MFHKLVHKVTCYLCMTQEHMKFHQCKKCKKLICNDCKQTVFVNGGRICFFCSKPVTH